MFLTKNETCIAIMVHTMNFSKETNDSSLAMIRAKFNKVRPETCAAAQTS